MNGVVDCLKSFRHSNGIAAMFVSTLKWRFKYWIDPRSENYFMEFITSNSETIISYNL